MSRYSYEDNVNICGGERVVYEKGSLNEGSAKNTDFREP